MGPNNSDNNSNTSVHINSEEDMSSIDKIDHINEEAVIKKAIWARREKKICV